MTEEIDPPSTTAQTNADEAARRERECEKTVEIQRFRLDHLRRIARRYWHRKMESPIEAMLFDALLEHGDFDIERGFVDDVAAGNERGELLCPQYQTIVEGRVIRIDFAILASMVAVECDGHDFHERTKEQAERDRSRDRALQLAGWTVLRFTGSEIHRDALACAQQVAEAVRRTLARLCPDDCRCREVK